MSILYPEEFKPFSSGLKNYWGSLYGSSEALALIEFAESQNQVVLYIAKDITHYDEVRKALNFFNHSLEILEFSSWEVLAFDHFLTTSRYCFIKVQKHFQNLPSLKSGIVITTLETLSQRLCPKDYIEIYSLHLKTKQNLEIRVLF